MSTFDRYAPFIQDFIYAHDWENLRSIQVAAADAIFNTDENVLLCASTASGKTEAALFPILTLFWQDQPTSIGAVYIAPLKALINDQFLRLGDLCDEADIPVWRWHGDVSASHKSKMLRHPQGILQITPESLEALLMHKHGCVPRAFCDLRFVIIDEVHSVLRGERGAQTLCLIERLSRMAGARPRRIGLSATIGDPRRCAEMLGAGTGRATIVPRFEEPRRTWRLSMEHFYISGPQASEAAVESLLARQTEVVSCERIESRPIRPEDGTGWCAAAASADGAKIEEESSISRAQVSGRGDPASAAPVDADPGIGYIFEHTRRRKCLVFVNSREEAEAVCTMLRSLGEALREPDRFLIHHGNLSSSFRETAEQLMRDEEQNQTTVTTATLELGIDIGRLECAFQIDAPWTVSSFLQRMGRTGRRDLPPEMHFVMREEQPQARDPMPQTVPWKLIQGCALIQLYREERWVEPPRADRLPYSLLYHQTMATLAGTGELSCAALAERVLTLSPFHRVSLDDYRTLLTHLLQTDHLERTEGGGLIIGLAGERVVNSYKFYAVFQENEEFTVRCASSELGTIVNPPPPGERIAIAGHCWIVEEIDWKRHLVYCTQVKGRVPAYFGECPGDIHTRVLERMRGVLAERDVYPYLLDNARARLDQARRAAQLSGAVSEPLICLGGDTWCLMPWLGSYAFLALERLLKIRCARRLGLSGMDVSRPYFLQFKMKADAASFISVVSEAAEADFEPIDLLYPTETPNFNKYDRFLPTQLVRKGFAEGVLDIEGMRQRVRQWAAGASASRSTSPRKLSS